MTTSQLSAAQQAQLDNRDSTGQWKTKEHGGVEDTSEVLGLDPPGPDTGISPYDYSNPSKVAGDYLKSFESITRNWPDTIHVASNSGPSDHLVTASHQPDMGDTTSEFRAEYNENSASRSQWQWSIDGEVQAEGSLSTEQDIQRAEMYQDAFVGQAEDDDALGGMHDSLNHELSGREGYQVSPGWAGFIDDHTEQHELRIDEPDGGAWEVLQLRHDPRVADMDGEDGLELYEAERGNRDYASEHYISRINPDGSQQSLEGEEPYESIDEAINEIRDRTGNFGRNP